MTKNEATRILRTLSAEDRVRLQRAIDERAAASRIGLMTVRDADLLHHVAGKLGK